MDEILMVEYVSDMNPQKRPITIQKWVETDKITEIVYLNITEDNN
jgi:hypothetical protein